MQNLIRSLHLMGVVPLYRHYPETFGLFGVLQQEAEKHLFQVMSSISAACIHLKLKLPEGPILVWV